MDMLPVEVYSGAQVRAMDRRAINEHGIDGYTLMQRAGAAAWELLGAAWPARPRLVIACGAGNNAGDGYVLARLARDGGREPRVLSLVDPKKLSGDAARAWADYAGAGGKSEPFDAAALAGAGLIVDALLGTGLDRPVEGRFREAIDAINVAGAPVFALDIPSGLDADSGEVCGAAVRATRTLTFVGLKAGLFTGDAREHVGRLSFADLELPASVREAETPVLNRLSGALLAEALPRRAARAHKGSHGRVLVVGGGPGMPGAARLAGEAALRTGAGLVTVAAHPDSATAIVAGRPELICHAVTSASELKPLLARADVVALGPGLGRDERAAALCRQVLAAGLPTVVDADALTLLAKSPQRREDWVLTPHPGEAARLLGSDVATIERDRLAAVRAIADRYGGVCVLKGAGTLVAGASGVPWICDRGNPGMATAGTGDVLTGIIAALIAQGAAPGLAAAAGVLLHARAGDLAAAGGERGLLAGDLIAQLPGAVNPPWN